MKSVTTAAKQRIDCGKKKPAKKPVKKCAVKPADYAPCLTGGLPNRRFLRLCGLSDLDELTRFNESIDHSLTEAVRPQGRRRRSSARRLPAPHSKALRSARAERSYREPSRTGKLVLASLKISVNLAGQRRNSLKNAVASSIGGSIFSAKNLHCITLAGLPCG
jgi:hypothetical protein